MTPPKVPASGSAEPLEPQTRRVAASAAAAAAIGWWPAFTLGVYGVVFFEQSMALWAVATAVFVAGWMSRGLIVWRSGRMLALLLPSLWLLLAWLLPVGGSGPAYEALYWFGIVVTIIGFPVMAAVMVRLLIPGAGTMAPRQVTVALLTVAAVMASSYLIGTQHPRLFTCEDFTISGNYAPEGCTPGAGTTRR